jgi:hypothetical protein
MAHTLKLLIDHCKGHPSRDAENKTRQERRMVGIREEGENAGINN